MGTGNGRSHVPLASHNSEEKALGIDGGLRMST